MNGEVVCVRCPICERPVSELDYEAVDIDEVFEGQDPKKEEEVLHARAHRHHHEHNQNLR